MGETHGEEQAWLKIVSRNGNPVDVPDGAVSEDGRIWGCYLHGIFANDNFRRAWLGSLGWKTKESPAQATLLEEALDRLADAIERALNMDLLGKILWKK